MTEPATAEAADVPPLTGVESRMRIGPTTEPTTTKRPRTAPSAAARKPAKASPPKAGALPPTARSGTGIIDVSSVEPAADEAPSGARAADMLREELDKISVKASEYAPETALREWHTPLTAEERQILLGPHPSTPFVLPQISPELSPGTDESAPRYRILRCEIPFREDDATRVFSHERGLDSLGGLPFDLPHAAHVVSSVCESDEVVCGIPHTARLGVLADEDRPWSVDRVDFFRWAWSAYTGALFARNHHQPLFDDVASLAAQFPTNRLHYRAKETYAVPETATDADQSLFDAVKAASAVSPAAAPVKESKLDPNVGIPRPNGELYYPRKIRTTAVKTRAAGKTTLYDVEALRRSHENNIPVLLTGPPGTGKSALVEASLPDVITVPGTADTETADFIGSYVQLPDGSYEWVDGPLLEAMDQGRPLFIDEIALIDSRVLAVVYSVMDGRDELRVTANPKRGTVTSQPGFYVLGACNPDVPGAVLSDALLSRFRLQVHITTDYDLAVRLGVLPELVVVAQNLGDLASKGAILRAPEMRDLLAFQQVHDLFGREVALANLISRADENDRHEYISRLSSSFGGKIDALRV